ncbi:MAG: hypothetical protein IPJ07_20405 [Acidobacteria bacterium]|nr:hypothetical protein [Acidobacteriota bacterium]
MLANVLVQMKKPEEAGAGIYFGLSKGVERLAIVQFQPGRLYYDKRNSNRCARMISIHGDVPGSALWSASIQRGFHETKVAGLIDYETNEMNGKQAKIRQAVHAPDIHEIPCICLLSSVSQSSSVS